ncbi:MAG: heparinase II/III family protein [Fimbriimonadaceae bacterium]|nr:heparinase II/III family protein [Fimbriimonadaceae bacterium]
MLLWLATAIAAEPRVFTVTDDAATRQRLASQVAYLMSLSTAEVLDIVPTSSGGIYFTDCPNCEFGAEEAGCFNTTWNPRQPHQLTCKGCGATYPGHPQFPDQTFQTVAAPGGREHRFHYWERADGYRTYFRAHADYWAREWLEDQVAALGDLYHLTREDRYAERALLILNRFAEVYPGWATIFDYPFRPKILAPYTVTRIPGVEGFRNSRWTWWAYMDIPLDLVKGWDGLQSWPALRAGANAPMAQRIEQDLFDALIQFVLGIDEDYTNMSMGMWRAGISAGRVLRRPEWVHDCVRRLERLLQTQFLYDGHWMETADSYAAQTDGGLRVVFDAANGYSDPPNYRDAVDGRRFDQLDLRQVAPGFEAQAATVGSVRLPDNRLVPVNDTWAVHGKTNTWWRDSQRTTMQPVLLPATGLAVLGGGAGQQQVHAYLNHTMGRYHKHHDALSIGLFANGRELAPDIGYTWTNYRLHWPTLTHSHNTVVVDGLNSALDREHTGHRLREFAVADGFQVSSVDALSAYPQRVSRYRRTLAMVGHDSSDCYFVDVFEVAGGQQHDWLLLGSVDEDSTPTVAGATLTPYGGTLLNAGLSFTRPRDFGSPNPDGHAFGFWEHLQRGELGGPTVTLATTLVANPAVGLRSVLAPGSGATVYLGRVPSVRRAQETNGLLDRDLAPAFCVRRSGAGLASRFVAVHEPLRPGPALDLQVSERDGVLLLRIARGRQVDWYMQSLTDGAKATFATPAGPLEFAGDFALVRQEDDGWQAATLVGERLRHGLVDLRAEARTGAVLAVGREPLPGSRSWLEVAGPAAAPGTTLMLTFADGSLRPFNIAAREPRDGRTRYRLVEDLGFEVTADQTRLTSYPQRTIPGSALTCRVAGLAHWTP